MDNYTLNEFSIIGIAIKTTNENGQSSKDIPMLWQTFIEEGIATQIPNKIDHSLYCVYTDYEKDHTRPYLTLLGCKVNSLSEIPKGMIGKTIPKGTYLKQGAKGDLTKNMVFEEWEKIWNLDLPRAFTADYEVYGEKAQDIHNAEVDIFLSVK
jgi:predicted transcriptional regulator YdeE